MNIPISWLKDYVDIDVDIKEFSDKMTMSGTKVEMVQHLGKDITNVAVGKILSIKKHPSADKLVIAQVDVGTHTVQIATAATNVFESAIIPVALDGANLAGGLKIKSSKLRGELSEGMMVSVEELGYTRADFPEAPEDGIYIFDKEYPLGADVKELLDLVDTVVEFELTTNRPDCYSVVGVAREVAATFGTRLKEKEIVLKEANSEPLNIAVEIENSELCKRYVARVVKNVKIGPSPQWLRRRLTSSGIRPKNNIVDITNYVMLELGQPIHAFDLDKIADNKIIVRTAKDGEAITTLDGVERKLSTSNLVIADAKKPVAIAGVMGSEESAITDSTTSILFESANFDNKSVRLTSKQIGLRTDASTKYEKGLDPNLSEMVINRCMELVEQLGYGEIVKGYVDVYPTKVEGRTVSYSPESINKLLGTKISEQEMETILASLGIDAKNGVASTPTFRQDIEGEADLAEEIIRIYGFDKLEAGATASSVTLGKKNRTQLIEDIIVDTAVAAGLSQMISYSFESAKAFEKLGMSTADAVKIKNPLGEDFSIMRTSLLNGMLSALSLNYSKRNAEANLFELSKVYTKSVDGEQPIEKMSLSIGMYGMGKNQKDFYHIKGVVEALIEKLGIDNIEYEPVDYPFMHPSRTANILHNGDIVGFVGEIHPNVADSYELDNTYVAILDVDRIFEITDLSKTFVPLPRFPGVERDIAMIIGEEITVADIEKAIKAKGTKLLSSAKLFDVYKGKQIESGKKSVAFSLIFRDTEKTLQDSEINPIMEKIIIHLETSFKAKLRES